MLGDRSSSRSPTRADVWRISDGEREKDKKSDLKNKEEKPKKRPR